MAVDCDTYAYLNGFLNDQPFSIGWLSRCQNIGNVVNGKCSGIGCCQIQIPGGLKNISLEAYSFKKHSFVFDFNPCHYALIIREDKFKFSSAYLSTLRNNKTLPMVLDWTICSEKCDLARNKLNYICGENMLKIRSVLNTRASIEIQLKEEAVIKPSKQRQSGLAKSWWTWLKQPLKWTTRPLIWRRCQFFSPKLGVSYFPLACLDRVYIGVVMYSFIHGIHIFINQ